MSTAAEIEVAIGATPPTKKICHVYAICGNSIANGHLQAHGAVSGDTGLPEAMNTKYWNTIHEGVWRLNNKYLNYNQIIALTNKYDPKYVQKIWEPRYTGLGEDQNGYCYSAGMIIFPRIKELYAEASQDIDIAFCHVSSLGVGFTQTTYDNFNLNMPDAYPAPSTKCLIKITARNLALTIRHMEEMGYDVRVKGILCVGQGVADCWDLTNGNITIANLTTAITEVINYFRTTLGYTGVPFYISQTTQVANPTYAAAAVDYEAIISNLNVSLGDVYIHYPHLWQTLKDSVHPNGASGYLIWGEGEAVGTNKNMAELIYAVETGGIPNGDCTGLGITVINGGTLQLDWTNGSTDETAIVIERKLHADSVWIEVTRTASGVETYTDADLLRNTEYDYRVYAIKDLKASEYSNVATATTANTGPDGSVSALTVTALDESSIKLDWTNGSTDETGISIERSLLGVLWTEIHVTAPGVATYTNTGLTSSTKYYYRVRAVKSGEYSNYSSIVSDYTAWKVMVGYHASGVVTFSVTVNANTLITIDGNGKFYSDAAGTLDESTTWTPTSGGTRARYIRNTVSNCYMRIFSKNTLTGIVGWTNTSSVYLTTTVEDIPRTLASFTTTNNISISGAIGNAPPVMLNFGAWGINTITGNLFDAPAGITYIFLRGSNRINNYTAGRVWASALNAIGLAQGAGYGFTQQMQIDLLIDVDKVAWSGAGRFINMESQNASMADTNQGGIWGDFSGVAAPSDVAIAYKSLIKTKSVTITMQGIAVPGADPSDGTGFPAGFGDWYRT